MTKTTKIEKLKTLLESGECLHHDFMDAMKEINLYPVTQHPDYENDHAYDIDDIIEVMELLLKDK